MLPNHSNGRLCSSALTTPPLVSKIVNTVITAIAGNHHSDAVAKFMHEQSNDTQFNSRFCAIGQRFGPSTGLRSATAMPHLPQHYAEGEVYYSRERIDVDYGVGVACRQYRYDGEIYGKEDNSEHKKPSRFKLAYKSYCKRECRRETTTRRWPKNKCRL